MPLLNGLGKPVWVFAWAKLMCVLLVWGLSTSVCAASSRVIVLAQEQVVRKKTTAELSFDLPRSNGHPRHSLPLERGLPEVPKGQQVRLGLAARVNYSYWCANNPAMRAAVNGKSIVGADLLNKPLEYHPKNGRDASWATPGGSSWLLFSWPDFSFERVKAYESPYAITEVNPFEFVWDITAYVKPGKNTVSFTHREITTEDHFLVLRDIRVEVGDPIASRSGLAVKPAPTGPVPTYVPLGRQQVPMQVQMGSGGTIRAQVGRRVLDFTSRTSEPDGRWFLTTGGALKTLPRGQAGQAQWSCPGYRVTRAVTVRDDHIHIADTFTNTGDKLVGVMYENALVLREKPLEVKVAGRPPYARYHNKGGGTNPTALVRWDDLAVGLVAEDDIFRSHVREFAWPDAVGLADHELGLDPGQSHTVEWSIYPVPQGDYWDFINTVRRNWGANFTIPGMHVFVDWSNGTKSDDYYRNWVRTRGVRMVSSFDAMFDQGKAAMGTAIPMAKVFCGRAAAWIHQLHSVAPEVKALVYMNCSLCTEPGAPEKYADSKLLDANGKQLTIAAGSPQGVTMAPLFISTLDNSYGRAMMGVAQWIVNDLKADGLYHDVFCSAGYGARAYSAPWDGCTVVIDPNTHAVVRKVSSIALLQQPWHVALVRYLREHGKMMIANGAVETRTMLDLHLPVFVETGFSFSCLIDTHLGSPWGYGNYPARDPSRGLYYNAAYNLRRILDYGGVLALPSWSEEPKGLTFLHLMYPITPIELREGMVLGEERILTNRSGRYGWPDGSAAEVYVLDGDGQPVAQPLVKEIIEGGRRLTEVRMPSDHFAILVRKQAEREAR